MSGITTGGTSIGQCSYCGNWHTYSEEMCRDMVKYQHSQPAIQTPVQLSISDDTIRTLRLANGRLRETLNLIECESDDPDAAGWARTALSTPDDGLWQEVHAALKLGRDGCVAIASECEAQGEQEDAAAWRKDVATIDALLGGKP